MILKAKNMFEPNVFKCVVKKDFTNFNFFFFLIINTQIFINFEKEWNTFDSGKRHLKKKNYPPLNLKCFIPFETSSISLDLKN